MLHGVEWLGKKYNALSKASVNQSLLQTVDTLATRLAQADQAENPLQERRAAVLSLKGLAKDHPKEVTTQAAKALLDSLVKDTSLPPNAIGNHQAEDDVAKSLVECLLALCTPPEPSQASRVGLGFASSKKPSTPVAPAALDLFLDKPEPLHALLPLLSPQRTFYLRFSSLQLLALLLRHRKAVVQSHVLISPGGCGAILDCLLTTSPQGHSLGSSAEIIRNEALLLLPHLVDSNVDIQKLIAFEGAFEKLLDVVAQEGRIEGGVVVQDALEALEALLRYNVSNQNYFRETLSIPLLAPLLFYPPPLPPNAPAHLASTRDQQLEAFAFQPWEYDAADEFAAAEEEEQLAQGGHDAAGNTTAPKAPSGPRYIGDTQKLINARLVIGIAGLLVQGVGEGKRANQNALLSTGFLHALLDLAIASSAPVPLKTQALQVLALLLKDSRTVQDALGEATVAPVEPLQLQTAADLATADAPSDAAGDAEKLVIPQSQPATMVEFARLPPQSALLVLVNSALEGMAPPYRPIDGIPPRSLARAGPSSPALLAFRAAAVKALQSILRDNIDARLFIVASMAGVEGQPPETQPGHLLLEGLTKLPSNGSADGLEEHRALLSAWILGTVVRGSETVKGLARRLQWGGDGRVKMLPEGEEQATAKPDDDDDEDASFLSVLIGNITIAMRSQSDALKLERKAQRTAAGSIASPGPTSTTWSRILVSHLLLLSLFLYSSPKSIDAFLADSSNLQALVQLVAEGANGTEDSHLVVGLGTWILGTVYEWAPVGPAPEKEDATSSQDTKTTGGGKKKGKKQSQAKNEVNEKASTSDGKITRREIHDLLTSSIGLDQFEARLQRLSDDPRLKLVGPDVLDRVGGKIDPITAAIAAGSTSKEVGGATPATSADSSEEDGGPELWFDWTWAEFWRYEHVTITNSVLVPPHQTSREVAVEEPAELQDARLTIEQLKDEVARLGREVEGLNRLIAEGGTREEGLTTERDEVIGQLEAITGVKTTLESELTGLQGRLEALQGEHASRGEAHTQEATQAKERITTLEKALEAAGAQMTAFRSSKADGEEEQVRVLKEQLDASAKKGEEAERSKAEAEKEVETIRVELERLKTDAQSKDEEVEKLRRDLVEASSKKEERSEQDSSTTAATTTGADQARVTELEQENQDLLIMLDELSTKRKKDKERLKAKGEEVSEDEEEDEDDEE